MPSLKRNCEILIPEAITPLPQIDITTPTQHNLPNNIEQLIGQSSSHETDTPKGTAPSYETPKMKSHNTTKYKIRPRILYEEANNISKIVENRKIESPKREIISPPSTNIVGFHNGIMINPPVSLKSRRQTYMQSRFSEKRQQRKQFELKRRAMSHDQMLFHFRDIIMDNLLKSEF